ncbi:hypothetical protein [Hydrogenophaga sp. NFH-34]|uniref:hypothetical protein n=1 Tax=Hydrogenophaga sp. NFH-34 TaxID=2744446 RepID=UPI001F282AAD|nr:hypothetical protein [Hydrogenophaga sp. NFH-34]
MKPGGLKLEFELDVDRAQLGVQDMKNCLESGDVDAFFAAGWASMAAIERSMQAVLAIKLGQLRAQDED